MSMVNVTKGPVKGTCNEIQPPPLYLSKLLRQPNCLPNWSYFIPFKISLTEVAAACYENATAISPSLR